MNPELPPLVLLHGLMMASAWRETAPLLAANHTVYAPIALGHRGGPAVQRRPVTIWDVVDAAERYLDEEELDRPHLAGNSMGGFVAIELARRGRAASVCAFSPAGFWSDDLRMRGVKMGRRNLALARLTRPLTPLMMKSAGVRRRAWRIGTMRGDRLSVDRALEFTEDALDCTIIDDIFNNADEYVKSIDPLPCPISIVWGKEDVTLPLQLCEPIVRDTLPSASFAVLPDVAHAPMLDDPELVARTILATTGATKT